MSKSDPDVHGAMGFDPNSFKLVWRCYQFLYGFLANDHLPRVLPHSRLSANDKGANEVKPGAVHRSPGTCFTAEGNPRKHQLGDRLMKTVRPAIASNPVHYHQMTARSHGTSGKEKEEERKEGVKSFTLVSSETYCHWSQELKKKTH